MCGSRALPDAVSAPYPLLRPSEPDSELAGLCALAVMTKAPRPGKVKTRLSPPLTLEQTAALNIRFLRDTTRNIAQVHGGSGVLCYTPVGEEAAFEGIAPAGFSLIPQRGDGFGERLHLAATDLLACGFGAVCLIDSDSPTLPHTALQQAVNALSEPGDRVVLGGSHDGGYYLIGLKQAHPEPFERITWSTESVHAETLERCRDAGLEVVHLPVWYDVDDASTLRVLAAELLDGRRPHFATTDGFDAAESREFLAELASAGEVSWHPTPTSPLA